MTMHGIDVEDDTDCLHGGAGVAELSEEDGPVRIRVLSRRVRLAASATGICKRGNI